MTGPEHYREAERLAALAESGVRDDGNTLASVQRQAQIHATLALVHVQAYELVHWGERREPPSDWVEVLSE